MKREHRHTIIGIAMWVILGLMVSLLLAGCGIHGNAMYQANYLCRINASTVQHLYRVGSSKYRAVCANGLVVDFHLRSPQATPTPATAAGITA
jgi:hypothetical protein